MYKVTHLFDSYECIKVSMKFISFVSFVKLQNIHGTEQKIHFLLRTRMRKLREMNWRLGLAVFDKRKFILEMWIIKLDFLGSLGILKKTTRFFWTVKNSLPYTWKYRHLVNLFYGFFRFSYQLFIQLNF